MKKKKNKIIDGHADCVAAPQNEAVLLPVGVKCDDHCESRRQRTAPKHLSSSRSRGKKKRKKKP